MCTALRYITVLGAVGLFLTTAIASRATTLGTWRPFTEPTELITLGMSKATVLAKAGSPQATELGTLDVNGLPFSDVWLYVRMGYNAAVATLTFSGDRLVNIDVQLTP